MTSKQALEHICKICNNKSCPYIYYEKSRCSFYGVIKQDLERLKNLEDNVKIHKETIKMQQNQIKSLQSENKEIEKKLKQKKSNFKNSQTHSKNRYKKLKEKNQELLVNKNVAQGIAFKLKEENTKLKKVIEILKENFEIALHYNDEFPTPMISVDGTYSYINKQEYELLKEVLGNENSNL